MRSVFNVLALAAVAGGLSVSLPAKAATNVPLCLQLAESYNQCQREAQWQNRRGGHGGWGGHGGYGYGDGYGGGYGGGWGGGYGGYDEDDYYWRQRRRAARSQSKQAECARWLVALQQNGCAPR